MKIFVLAIAMALSTSVAHSQSAQTEIRDVSTQSAIEGLERIWADALVTQDIGSIANLLDARFQLVMTNSSTSGDFDDYLKLCEERAYTSMTPKLVDVTIASANVAVATIDMKVGWPEDFPPLHSTWRFTDTWLLTDYNWKVVTRVAEPVR